jgi:hypothetical protein
MKTTVFDGLLTKIYAEDIFSVDNSQPQIQELEHES